MTTDETCSAAVNYGRDADSIASMAGALAGALAGTSAVPADWVDDIGAASRADLEEPGRGWPAIAARSVARDNDRAARRVERVARLDRLRTRGSAA